MGEFIDKIKGKVKEVTGVVTGNRKLEREGKIDRAKGSAKETFEKAKHEAKETLRGNPKA